MADMNDEMYYSLQTLFDEVPSWELLEEIFKMLDQDIAEAVLNRLNEIYL